MRNVAFNLGDLQAIAGMLPDSPETVISIHLLRRGLCRAHVAGNVSQFSALVIESDEMAGEPMCFGDDPEAVWSALREMDGWWAANVSEAIAEPLGMLAERDLGERVRYYGDIYHTLDRPVTVFSNPAVRLLAPDDLDLLENAAAEVRGAGYGGAQALLRDGIVAAAIVDERIVAIAHTSAQSDRHADIGVSTMEDYRCHGYATAAAALVAKQVQASGRKPIWSCGEGNAASLRVARKLGFQPVSRRVYLILESRRPGTTT